MGEGLKILVDAHAITAGYQGTHTFIAGLYNALHRVAPKVQIFFATTNAAAIKSIFSFVQDEHVLLMKKRKPAILRYWLDFPALLKKGNFHFAHFQYISPLAKHGCRFVVTTHDVLFNEYPQQFSWWYRFSRNLLFKRSIKKADIKTTVSGFSRNSISRHYGVSVDDITVLPNAVDEKFGHRMGQVVPSAFGSFILYVSRIEPRKNHLLLLTTYLRLALWQQGISLVFAGNESVEVPALQQQLAALPAEQRRHIHFLKNINTSQLEELYKQCSLFVYPSMAEGFGIPPLEAAACKVPVLCSNATAMGDFSFFEPYMFNPADEAGFTEKLKNMLAQPPTPGFINQVETTVRQKYSWHNTATIFYELLKEKGGAVK